MKTQMRSRNEFPNLLREMNLRGHAVEVGCAEGYNSWNILDHWPGRLTMVDPWAILDTPGFSGHGEATNAEQEARYQRILKRAEKYHGRCIVTRATSEQAAPRFADGSLDFVYIDSIHTFESCTQDIELWWPKVKAGGILAGHDYLDGVFQGQDYGVKRAVNGFASAHGLEVHTTLENDWPSWFIFKP